MRARADFSEEFELKDFPFDEQLVSVHTTLNMPSNRAEIVQNVEFQSRFLANSFTLSSVFELMHGNYVEVTLSHSAPEESSAGICYPRCSFSILLQVRPGGGEGEQREVEAEGRRSVPRRTAGAWRVRLSRAPAHCAHGPRGVASRLAH
jgi:hypothetical protein